MAVVHEIKVPLISVNDTSLTVIDTCFQNGDAIKKGDIILVFETSKTTYDAEAESTGFVQYLCTSGNDYEVDTIIALIHDDSADIKAFDKITPNQHTKVKVAANWIGETLFSNGALQLISQRGLDKSVFTGQDFINKEDVLEHLGESRKIQPLISGSHKKITQNKTAAITDMAAVVQKLSANKKREIEYLGSVQSGGLTSTINTFIETDGIFIHLNESLKALKDSLLPVTIYEASRLLVKYKELNAFYSDTAIHYYEKVNIGFAIDIGQGLKVLKIVDSNTKTMGEIENGIIDLSGKYLDATLQYADLTDVTFTITDLSSENVAFFRPLVNYMNSAILGMSAIDEKFSRCVFTVTFDHRVTEGKRVAAFLNDLKVRLESYKPGHFEKNRDISCFKCYKSLQEDLSGAGFAKCITPEGKDAFICQSCLKGF